jgi:Alkylmercury lyase
MDTEDLRLAVYHHLAETGRAPVPAALAAVFAVPEAEIEAGLQALHDDRHLVLRDGRIVMAHPFATIPLGFSVMGTATLWWGGCAWDAFALPHLLADEDEVLVATTCPGCGAALAWVVGTESPPDGEQVAHFLVPTDHMWDDVVHTCGHQRLFCREACVDRWLGATGTERGDVLDLSTLWRLASRWYEGRLDRGYIRREPAEAHAYFAAAGLTGAFWGL